jgi:hypothetical protein
MFAINIFNIYDKYTLLDKFYKSILVIYLIICLFLIINIFNNKNIFFCFFSLIFFLLITILSSISRFKKHPFSVLLTIYTFLFIALPIFFISYMADDFVAGGSIGKIPLSQIEYQENLANGMFFLTICWFSIWLGVITLKCNPIEPLRINSLRGLILLGVFVALATIENSLSIIQGRLEGTSSGISILALIFFDHSYLVLAGVLIFFFINEKYNIKYLDDMNNYIFLILILFIMIGFVSGSKASILTTFILLLILPLSLSLSYKSSKFIFVKPKFLIIIILTSPLLFLLALNKRTSQNYNFDDLPLTDVIFNLGEIYLLFENIFYRLTWGGLDQFFLLHHEFIRNSRDHAIRMDFIVYLAKNMVNLILPGTPFQDAYAPSSQLFPDLINGFGLYSNYDVISLAVSNNTQPYTIFGIFIIIFGLFAPFFLYIYIILISYFFKFTKNFILKTVILYFFYGMLSSYGFEVVIGNSLLFSIGLILMYMFLKLFSSKQILI